MIKQIPNILTASRLVLTFGFLILAAQADLDNPETISMETRIRMGWALLLFIVAGITDFLDGKLARKWNVTSAFGRWFDPLVDKIQIIGGFILLAYKPHTGIVWWMVGVIILREVLVTILRSLSEARGIAFGAIWTGKIKMVLQTVTLCLVIFQISFVSQYVWTAYVRDAFIWSTVLFTAWSAVTYTKRYWEATRTLHF